MGKADTWFINEQEFEVPDALPVGPPAGGSPKTAPVEGTTEGFVDGIPPATNGAGAGAKYESGSAVGGAMSVGNCCGPTLKSSKKEDGKMNARGLGQTGRIQFGSVG